MTWNNMMYGLYGLLEVLIILLKGVAILVLIGVAVVIGLAIREAAYEMRKDTERRLEDRKKREGQEEDEKRDI